MSVRMTDNLFYFISCIVNLFNLIANNHTYHNTYEHSLLYIFLLGLLGLNYTKIYESIKLIKLIKLYSINIFWILFFLIFMRIKILFLNSEVSLLKLCFHM